MKGYVILTCKYHKEDRSWVGVCDELGTSTFGKTLDEAEEKLRESIMLHLVTLEEVGERERFFKENNVQFYARKPHKVTIDVETNTDYFVSSCVQRIEELIPV
jgi:predicted RNase H-like HicB family nuclease